MGSTEPAIAFATRTFAPPALEIRVNFGVFAGREATPAEIDDLGAALLAHSEASVHQVRIEVSGDELPRADREVDELRRRLIETAERWARDCASHRHTELSDAWPSSLAHPGGVSVSACSAGSHSA